MAAALGWDPSLVGFARRDDRGDSPTGYRERDLRDTEQPAFTVTEKARSWQRELVRLPTAQSGARSNLAEGFDPAEEPAQTVTSRVDRWQINTGRDWKPGGSREDAQIIDVTEHPAPAFTGKAEGQWWIEGPATTLQGDPRVFVPGGHLANDGRDNSRMKGRSEDAVRISVPEALMLQSFPADYPVDGLRTPQHIALGRAVELDYASADEIEGDLLQRVVHFSVLGVAGEDDEVLQCVVVADSVDVVHDLLALRPGDSAVLRDQGSSGEDVAALAGSGCASGLPALVRIERITVEPPLLPVLGTEATRDRLAFAVLARRLRRPPIESEPAVASALVVHEAEAASGMPPVASFEVAESHRAKSCRPAGSVKTKQFEQIGNAVPPLLGAHLLAPLVGMPPP